MTKDTAQIFENILRLLSTVMVALPALEDRSELWDLLDDATYLLGATPIEVES